MTDLTDWGVGIIQYNRTIAAEMTAMMTAIYRPIKQQPFLQFLRQKENSESKRIDYKYF